MATASNGWCCTAPGPAVMPARSQTTTWRCFWAEMNRLADLGTEILNDTGEFIHAMAYRAGSYCERTPLMHEIRADGVDL